MTKSFHRSLTRTWSSRLWLQSLVRGPIVPKLIITHHQTTIMTIMTTWPRPSSWTSSPRQGDACPVERRAEERAARHGCHGREPPPLVSAPIISIFSRWWHSWRWCWWSSDDDPQSGLAQYCCFNLNWGGWYHDGNDYNRKMMITVRKTMMTLLLVVSLARKCCHFQ